MLRRLLLILAVSNQAWSVAFAHDHDHAHGPAVVHYVSNQGQWPSQVLYRSSVAGAVAFLEGTGITWVKYEDGIYERMHGSAELSLEEQRAMSWQGHAWRMEFVDGRSDARVEPSDRQQAYHNYFLGDDPDHWAGRVPLYGEVRYTDVWPGIDLRFHGEAGHMKYDALVAAGADASKVRFRYRHSDGLVLGRDGSLILRTSVGEVKELAPVAYYGDGDGEPVACKFMLNGDQVGFGFPSGYDARRPLVIDPVLIASTLSGATGSSNYGHCATYDDAGNIYSGARNFGPSYPATMGAFQMNFGGGGTDISISKYNPDGSALLYATYLGGSSGENPHSLVVSTDGELCVLGSSLSNNYPTTPGAFDNTLGGTDIVITRFTEDGSALVGSTFVGGNGVDGTNNLGGNYGEAYRGEIFLDNVGNMVVASFTQSADFPTTPGAYQTALAGGQDGVVFTMDPSCSTLLWSTFLGGPQGDGAFGVRIAMNGDVLVTGSTLSQTFPTTPGSYQPAFQGGQRDGFVVRLSPNGTALVASTFFGTSGEDRSYFIDTDLNDDVWIYGQTGGNMPISPAGTFGTPGGNGGVFVAKLLGDLSDAPVTTKIGQGISAAVPVAFLVDVCDNIYISGFNSSNLPLTPDALYTTGSFYLAAFEENMGDILFGTRYGGSHVDGGTSRFDKNGIVYQGVCSGTGSLQTTPWAHATNQTIGWDVGVFKIDFQVAGVNAAGASTLNSGCAPIVIDFVNNSTGDTWIWDFGDGSPPVEEFEPSHLYTAAGDYTVTLIALDSLSCNLADTVFLNINIGQAQPITADFTIVQVEDCEVLQVVGTDQSNGPDLVFEWNMGDGTTYNTQNITHIYEEFGTYDVQLIATDATGCSSADTTVASITLLPPVNVVAGFDLVQEPGCDELLITTQNTSVGVTPSFTWVMSDGTTLNGTNVSHLFVGVGEYTVTLIAEDPGACNQSDEASITVEVLPSEPVLASFTADQQFDCDELLLSTTNTSTGTNLVFLWEISDGTQYTDTNVVHTLSGAGTYDVTLTVSDALGCSPPSTTSTQVTIEPLVPVVADLTVEPLGNCTELTVLLTNNSTGDNITLDWDMGDGTTFEGEPGTHTYTTPGTYTITLIVTDLACGQNDQMSVEVELIDALPIVITGDAVVCEGESIVLVADGSTGNYAWSTGDNTPFINVDEGGEYTVTVTTDDCQGTATAQVVQGVRQELGYALEACPTQAVLLSIPLEGLSYSWSNGATTRELQVLGPGDYPFEMIDLLGCPQADTVRVIGLDAEPQLFLPNAFSPNGDGVNDVFNVLGFGEKEVELTIFNRWGEQLWQTRDVAIGWDGRYNGTLVQNGVYVYRLKYDGVCDTEEREVIGHLTVVR